MTTTCISQTTTDPTAAAAGAAHVRRAISVSAARSTASIVWLRALFSAMTRQGRGSEGRSTRRTPSQAAIESIESFPGLHR